MPTAISATSRAVVLASMLAAACGDGTGPLAGASDAGAPSDADDAVPPESCDPTTAASFTGAGVPSVDWVLEASGQSSLGALVATVDGGALVIGDATEPITFGGQAIAGAATPDPFAAWVDAAGQVLAARRLLAGADVIVMAAVEGATPRSAFGVFMARGHVVLDPDGAATPLALSNDDHTLVVLGFDPDGVAWSTLATGRFGAISIVAGHDGGALLFGATADGVELVAGGTTIGAVGEQLAEVPGHGFVASIDRDGQPRWVHLIDGTTGSAVSSAVPLPGGRVAIGGRFGGVPRGAGAIFGDADDAPTLVSVSGDDDAAFDGYVALVESGGAAAWARRIISYNVSLRLPLYATSDGLAVAVESTGYDTIYDLEEPGEVRVAERHSRAEYDLDGALRWAAPTSAYQAVGASAGLAEVVGPAWVDQQGDQPRLEIPLEPGLDHNVLLALGERGEVLGARHLTTDFDDGAGAFRLIQPGCGARWFVAGSPYGAFELAGSGGVVTLPDRGWRTVVVALGVD